MQATRFPSRLLAICSTIILLTALIFQVDAQTDIDPEPVEVISDEQVAVPTALPNTTILTFSSLPFSRELDFPATLYRTQITLSSSYRRTQLDTMNITLIDDQVDSGIVLVNELQLEQLARLGYEPTATDDLGQLVAAGTNSWLADSLTPQVDAIARQSPGTPLVLSLSPEQVVGIQSLTSIDDDADGLTNTQELWWCTNPLSADTDGDGAADGVEIQAAKDWLRNRVGSYASTGKPFAGWPSQIPGCRDDDLDSVPDLAEVWELGMNPNRESTDRDKFDDGQELFGNTYCPGSGGFCGYGALPRNEDWGVIFAEMPSWVRAPGNHPFIAAYPMPDIDLVQSSINIQTVTTITTDHVIQSGTERTYATARTEGTSTSTTNTVTWNDWEEVSHAVSVPQNPLVARGVSSAGNRLRISGWASVISGSIAGISCGATIATALTGIGAPLAIGSGAVCIGSGAAAAIATGTLIQDLDDYHKDQLQETTQTNTCAVNSQQISCTANSALQSNQQATIDQNGQNSTTQDRTAGSQYQYYSAGNDNRLTIQPVMQIQYPPQVPVITNSQTSGHSQGGALATTTEQYEEHTITNAEAFSSGESWGSATAVDSRHAADLWFTYRVRNIGTEYVREIGNVVFNVYIGDEDVPDITYPVAPDIGGNGKFQNIFPYAIETRTFQYTSSRIPLSLEQIRAIDTGSPIRIVLESFSYGIDEPFYQDALNGGVLFALEDGNEDENETVDYYLLPTWGAETVQNVIMRYFPSELDTNGHLQAIWTPEYLTATPNWCLEPNRIGTTLWCKHSISVADWWNIYLNGLGSDLPLRDHPAAQNSTVFMRFNTDSDFDGYSDRSELELGTNPHDVASFPYPEIIGGLASTRTGNIVTATLSLLNTGLYDAYGVEAIMVAPDDSITITNNTVGGSGRVRGQRSVIVGSRILAPAMNTWTGTAQPSSGGYYTGSTDRTYTFTVQCSNPGGCDVSSGTWAIGWTDGTVTGTLNFGIGYASPNLQTVGAFGVKLSFLSGRVYNGNSFTVAAHTPRDTFQYTINREPYTEPIVIVSYNDPQGNHRFITPIRLSTPTENLTTYSGQILRDVGLEIVTTTNFGIGANMTNLVVNNSSGSLFKNAHLFLEFIDSNGNVVAETQSTIDLPAGPNVVAMTWNTSGFVPAYDPTQDYIVLAFWTDYEGNILDMAGRPLSSFQSDPRPDLAMPSTTQTWDFGNVRQGTLLQREFVLANIGYTDLLTYLGTAAGITVTGPLSAPLAPGDMATYAIAIDTAQLSAAAFERTIPIRTSDPDAPTSSITIRGTILPFVPDEVSTSIVRPLDYSLALSGNQSQGTWIERTHNLRPDPATLHPVRVFSENYATLWGVGRYATDFGTGTSSADMFGTGRDGDLTVATGQTVYANAVRSSAIGVAGQNAIYALDTSGFQIGDEIMVMQTQGDGTGSYEFGTISAINPTTGILTLTRNLSRSYGGFQYASSTCGQGITAQYFNNMDLSGSPVFTRCDSSVNFNWGTGSPGGGLGSDRFSIRWTGVLQIPTSANYQISVPAIDDGIRIYLDGNLILDEWHHANGGGYSVNPFIQVGNHTLVIEHFEDGGDAKITVSINLNNDRAQVVRVAHYRNVTVQSGGILTAYGWNGSTGGVVAFRSNGIFSVAQNATVTVGGLGYSGGSGSYSRPGNSAAFPWQGESINQRGTQSTSPNITGGGGGSGGDAGAGGGGGGYATNGANGANGQGTGGSGGQTIGSSELTSIFFGGGGGGGRGESNANCPAGSSYYGGSGGSGGGIILAFARQITLQGQLNASGSNGQDSNGGCDEGAGGGGAGAGGSILLRTGIAELGNNLLANIGGVGGDGSGSFDSDGGYGGNGRIRIEYCDTLSGATNPIASLQKLDCFITEQVETTPFTGFRLNLPESFTNGRTYRIQFGRRLIFSGAGSSTSTLRVNRQVYNSASLEALISNTGIASGNLTLCIDIAANGTCDFTHNSTTNFPSSLNVGTLVNTLNAYLVAQTTVPWGTSVDVPVRVQVNRQADVVLTNLQLTTLASRTRFVRLPVTSYNNATINLSFTRSGGQSAPLSFAVDVGGDGTVDWSYTSTGNVQFPNTQSSPNLANAVNAYLAGRSGDVDIPIRIYVTPSVAASLTALNVDRATRPDSSIAVGDIQFSEGSPIEGTDVTIQATLRNPSTVDLNGVTVSLYATLEAWGNVQIGSMFVELIPAGGSAVRTLLWNTLGFTGNIPVTAVVDPYNRVAESSEANNSATRNLSVLTRPDLHIASISLSDPQPVVGQTVRVTAVLRNAGQANAASSDARLYIGNPTNGGILVNEVDIPLGGEASASVEFDWTPTTLGYQTLFVVSDEGNAVNEFNESNNVLWEELYVGFAEPRLLDSGGTSDVLYSAESGYGYLNGEASDYCGTMPDESQRVSFTGQIDYRFDHLVPSHFYHLDVVLWECDGIGRQQTLSVDGNSIGEVIELGDGSVRRLSIRLDPAFYADRSIDVAINELTGFDAIVSQINLIDVDYRYSDSGGTSEAGYSAARSYGWIDGVANTFFGTLPFQSRRIDLADSNPADNPDNELVYRFDDLDPSKRYQLHMTFYQRSGSLVQQTVKLDSEETGVSVDLTGDQRIDLSFDIPIETYSSDSSLMVKIVRLNAAAGAFVNEIALEELTILEDTPSLPVVLALAPDAVTTAVGSIFNLDIEVRSTEQAVETVGAYIDFDPALLEVTDVIHGTDLPPALGSPTIDNDQGNVDIVGGILGGGSLPSGSFTLATIQFRALAPSEQTEISFAFDLLRQTDALLAGSSVLDHTEDAIVQINDATAIGLVTLQGRPAAPNPQLVVPLRLVITRLGEPNSAFDAMVTTDQQGRFPMPMLPDGTYEICVKSNTTLSNRRSVVINASVTQVDLGVLREGDTNNDDLIILTDFSILASTFGKSSLMTGFDVRADFNKDGAVTLTDFSMLASNFGKMGDCYDN